MDPEGKNYCDLMFNWYYNLRFVDIFILKYIPETLKKLSYIPKTKPQYSLHRHIPIQYGNKEQQAHIDDSPRLDSKEIKQIQSIVSSFLYYTRVLDYTLLPVIKEISSTQAKLT